MQKLSKLLATLLIPFMLASCSGGELPSSSTSQPVDEEGVDEVVEPLVMPTNVTAFTLDDTDYDSLEEAPTDMIRIFYRRNDVVNTYENYIGWRIWAWDSGGGGNGWWYEFTKYNAYGVICEIPMSEVAANKTSTSQIGIVITTCESTTATWEGEYSKDPNADVMCDVMPDNKGGIQRFYVKSGLANAFKTQDSVFMTMVDYVRKDTTKDLRIVYTTPHEDFKIYRKRLTIKINGKEVNDYEIKDFKLTFKGGGYQAAATITCAKAFAMDSDIQVSYRVTENNISTVKAVMTSYYDSEDFINNYSYTGSDLGATFDNEDNPTKTIFKVWSPVSKSMKLNIYNSGDYREEETPRTIDMTLGEKGVWSTTVDEDLDGKYYTYVVNNDAGTNEVVDPYAKSAGLNGKRGMIVNFTKLNKELTGWNEDVRPDFGTITNASIYEIHVRDMTINPNSEVSEENRGKYLGLTEAGLTHTAEDGTKVSTGLDHLGELGITHVQIQPTYDYSSVDESLPTNVMSKTNYNWGYDPQNYNALEGSYSSNPSDGYSRIKEFKQMVMALHSKGVNAIMDVVYNHTSSFTNSNFELLVPNYYHRTKNSGIPYNGSGCGNEMASERFMVNKFVRESCKFWTDEYHLGGFRFDLMGLMDNQVMIDIYKDCHAIYDKILVFGEPWTGGSSKLSQGNSATNLTKQQTVQSSLNQSYFVGDEVYVGAFSDGFRNNARGDNSPGQGYVGGVRSYGTNLLPGIRGLFNKSDTNVEPQQVINYVSCHDNYTLYDQLIQNRNGRNLNDAYSQAETLVFTSQGIAFMQEGEDFLRSKAYVDEEGKTKYQGNSYNVGDFVNNMDYDLKAKNINMFNYFKNLIQFRKDHEFLRLDTREKINNAITKLESNDTTGVITYELTSGNNSYLILHTPDSINVTLTGSYEVMLTNTDSVSAGNTLSGSVLLKSNTSVVLKKQ